MPLGSGLQSAVDLEIFAVRGWSARESHECFVGKVEKSRKKSEGVRLALGDSNRNAESGRVFESSGGHELWENKLAAHRLAMAQTLSRFIPGSMLFIAQAEGSLNTISRSHRTPIRTRSGWPFLH